MHDAQGLFITLLRFIRVGDSTNDERGTGCHFAKAHLDGSGAKWLDNQDRVKMTNGGDPMTKDVMPFTIRRNTPKAAT
jgi:hypothetical protein